MQERQIENHFLSLSACLEDILSLYSTLHSIVSRERELLLQADADTLMENTKSKEMCLHKLRGLDADRLRFAAELGRALGSPSDEPRLLELAGLLPKLKQGEHLRNLHAALEVAVTQVYEINRDNKNYAESALVTLKGALGEIKQTLAPKPVYGRQGKLYEGSERSGHFVSREG